MLNMANMVAPTKPTEYLEITIVLSPVFGPRVAMKPQQAAPIAVNDTIAATADLNDKEKKLGRAAVTRLSIMRPEATLMGSLL